ncbi:NADPH2:quinone reductase [Actinacidiphila yanglinensis]|uniref:NADPH2:quinone reductase n=1 Tax=Actinacidiphila yanglinensis TaxID=310779 RepID=A0A1H6DQT3_9ACTN|nr:zinc-binding alcohol dehydrogenase family protein [Actinacidiphila yanglinensis]SEG87659.1 NADPH2:quinone reductase [Actinacidiphila yanglinensis]
MHAAVVTRFGDPEVLALTELPDPVPGPGQVAIDVSHAAVGLIDVYLRQGLYKDQPDLPRPPYVPGLEVAGTVRALGEGVTDLRVGEPVVTLSGTGPEGGYASIAVVDAALTAGLDGTGVDPAPAVAAVPNAATAYLAYTAVAHLRPGERVLVHGALGGLASGFPGMARMLGASHVVGTVLRSALPQARESALPYDEIVASEDLAEALGDRRFDVVVDPVGGLLRTRSLPLMAPMGRMLLVGNASGDWEHTVPTSALWGGNLAMLGFAVGFYLPAHPEQGRPAAEAALKAVGQGLADIPTLTLPLAEAAEAHRLVESGSTPGRILLAP